MQFYFTIAMYYERTWIIVAIIVAFLFNAPFVTMFTNKSFVVEPGRKSFAEQIMDFAETSDNRSFSVFVRSGVYNATNGNYMNFINFVNVTIAKDPQDTGGDVRIMCPKIGGDIFSGIGFVNSFNISIVELNFMRCGPVTSALYIYNSTNILILDSTFHHNTDNGIQIILGNNIIIKNCYFYSNIGMQPDPAFNLISTNLNSTGGVGLGLYFANQFDVRVSIENCTFKNNIAYKPADYVSSEDRRPFGYTPFGNGGGVYLQLNGVQNLFVNIYNCRFYENFAIHQGGGMVMISIDSNNNTLNISDCQFIGNGALGNLLRSLDDSVDDIDTFINETKMHFTSLIDVVRNLSARYFAAAGGVGGAISVSLYGRAEFNKLYVRNSCFLHNSAVIAGTISFAVRDSFSSVENGIDSNRAFMYKYVNIY